MKKIIWRIMEKTGCTMKANLSFYFFASLIPRCLQRFRKEKPGQGTTLLAAGGALSHIQRICI